MATYQIKKGDTLSAIANQFGTSVDAIASANGIANPNKIYAGNTLTIPDGSGASAGGATSMSASSSGGSGAPTYTQSQSVTDAYNQLMSAEASKPGDYTESDQLKGLRDKLAGIEANKPGDYTNAYQAQIDDLLGQIYERGNFEWDPKKDKLYQSYAEAYTRQGKQAMRDTMASATALTGGYGSSYAATAGSQAYDEYLQKLQDRVPELYQLALQSWQNETDSMYNKLNAFNTQEQYDYGKWRDKIGDWQTDRNFYADQTQRQYDNEYGQYRDTVGDWQKNQDYYLDKYNTMYNQDYGQYQDALAQYNADRDYNFEMMKYNDAKAAAAAKTSGSKTTSTNNTQQQTAVRVSRGDAYRDALSMDSYKQATAYINNLVSAGSLTKAEGDAVKAKIPASKWKK